MSVKDVFLRYPRSVPLTKSVQSKVSEPKHCLTVENPLRCSAKMSLFRKSVEGLFEISQLSPVVRSLAAIVNDPIIVHLGLDHNCGLPVHSHQGRQSVHVEEKEIDCT